MLSKGFRLRKSSDIERVFRRGKPLFFDFLGGKCIPREEGVLVTFIASKKHFPTAVGRNKAKRLFREAFRKISGENTVQGGEYAFFYTKRPESLTLEICENVLKQCLKNNLVKKI